MSRARMLAIKKQGGFTLIEVMIVVVIVGILASIAMPAYNQYVIRSNRAAMQAAMMGEADRQQQLLLANRVYSAGACTVPGEISGKYTCAVTVGVGTVPSFTITATATGSQSSDGNLTLDNVGTKTPSAKW